MHEYERMEEEPSTEILPNNEADDSSLQCTSVKDLIEKYENGTIFSNSEEKTDFEEKSGQIEEPTVTTSTITIAETTTTTTTTVAISVSPEILCSSQTESQSISEVSNVTQPKEAAPMYKTEEALNTDPKNCESEQKPIGLVTSEPDSPQESKAQDEKPDALVLCSTIDIPLEKPQLLTESSTSKISESPIVLDSSLGKVADAEAETSSLDVLSNSGDDFQPTRDTSLNLDLEIKTDSVSKTDESL